MGLQRKTDSTSVNGTGHCPKSSYGASECDINDIASHPFINIVQCVHMHVVVIFLHEPPSSSCMLRSGIASQLKYFQVVGMRLTQTISSYVLKCVKGQLSAMSILDSLDTVCN